MTKMISLIFLMFFTACSMTQKNSVAVSDNQNKLTLEQKAEDLEKVLVKTEAHLKKIVEKAKKEGSSQVEFLSSDLFIKASDASYHGRAKEAALLYKYVLSMRPNDVYVKQKLGIELVRLGELTEAKKLLLEVTKVKSNDENMGLLLGGVYTALEEKENARHEYERVLSFSKSSQEACIFLAKSYALDKHYKKSQKVLKGCKKNNPNSAIFPFYQGKISMLRQKLTNAISYFKEALKIDPVYSQAIVSLGSIYEEREKHQKAYDLYKSFLDKQDDYLILNRIVNVSLVLNKNDEVTSYMERLVSLDPEDWNMKARLAILYNDLGQLEKSKNMFLTILKKFPTSDKILYFLGAISKQQKDYEEAVSYFFKIKEESEFYLDSNFQIAWILKAMASNEKNSEKKEEIFKQLKSIVDKDFSGTEYNIELKVVLASFYEEEQKIHEAIEILKKVRGEKGYSNDHDYYLASLYEKAKKVDQARMIVKDILKKDPNNAHALNFLGYSLLEEGKNYEKAHPYIARAVELLPDDGYIRDSFGWLLYKRGRMKQAAKELEKASKLVPNEPVILKHLAIVHYQLNNVEKSKKFFQMALTHCKVESEKSEILKAMKEVENRLPASLKNK